ncbi:homeobox-leucine zipper protein roc3 [Phtheirospermum japonicum]|uniref:Homeobox-leucine zipper protein roc3 n=1 Tax=Phtheirospermum japonicum TaxID=374723 RepID=A0A830CXV1_9LAMI|nr:homeobox-leucine zipper protein roc3 [Phtheirospermum japonicum]
MYGDCQVLSSMAGGNSIPSSDNNSIFGSPSLLHNPSINNFNFMPNINPFNIFSPIVPKEENGMAKSKEDIESGSGSEPMETLSGNDQELDTDQQAQQQPKKKRYHRHTARQIQEMESLFKECPHPDDKQRLKLSQDLGLKPRQVKFWFQNRRTQMKAQQDRQDNVVLRSENESLKNDNYRLQAALRNIVCPNCGGPAMLGEMGYDEQQVRIENARLKEELDRVCCLVTQYTGRPMIQAMGPTSLLAPSLDLDISSYPRKFNQNDHSISNCPPHDHDHMIPNLPRTTNSAMIMEEEKPLAMDLAMSCIDELVKMCHTGEPLWIPDKSAGNYEVLNLEEYARMFSYWTSVNLKQHLSADQFRSEATRDMAVVIMNSITLVDSFLDANKWVELFPSIISRAKTLQVVHTEVNSGHATGSLHLMSAELQVLSPLVPTRETHFLRYCQHNAEEGSWAIVDFPVDAFQNIYSSPSFPYYRRRPSGCLIQDMPNGYSRVTWVEHAEVEDGPIHQVFNHLVNSGMAFGAQRWLAVLQCQCERFASLMARNTSDLGVIPSPQARKNLMNLAQRMIRAFCLNISTCNGQSWTALSDSADDTVRITTRKVTELGQPNGLILTAVSTTWLPYQHHQVFDFLRDERRRAQLEVLSNGNSLHEIVHIANGSHPGNCISLFRINVASNSSQSVELVLQESCSDNSGSIVVYTTVDVDAVQLVMNGEDSSCVPLLPLGFVVVPMGQQTNNSNIESTVNSDNKSQLIASSDNNGGCLLTIGLQVLASTIPTAKLNLSSVTAINHHLCNTVQQINVALGKVSGNSCSENGNVLETEGAQLKQADQIREV